MQKVTDTPTEASPDKTSLLSKIGKKFQTAVKKAKAPINVLQKITDGDYKKQFI